MALYTYRCEQHGEFDVIKPMAEAANPVSCPTCDVENPDCAGKHPALRVYTPSVLQPNGSLGDGYFGHIDKRGQEHRGNAKMAGRTRSRWV